MASAGPSTPLLDRLERAIRRNESREARGELVRELLVQLSSEAHEVRKDGRSIAETFFNDPFPLLDFLVPLLSVNEVADEGTMNTSDYVRSCLILVATVCSPKEVVMGVEQKLAELAAPDEWVDEDEGGLDGAWDPRESAFRLACLITAYTNALKNFKTKRPLQFLLPAVTSIIGAIIDVTCAGAFVKPSPNALAGATEGDLVANEIFTAVLHFTRVVGPWLMCCIGDDLETVANAVALLDQLLQQTAALLHPFMPVGLASKYFYERFPSYRQPGPKPELTGSQLTWELAQGVLYGMRLTPVKLLGTVTSKQYSPPARLGAFVTLVHIVAGSPVTTPAQLGSDAKTLLAQTMDVLRLGLAHPSFKLGEDEALFWLWWCLEKHLGDEEAASLASDMLFDLVDLVTPLASLSPDPQTRFLAFRLIARLVLKECGATADGEMTQLELLKQLVMDCPSPNLRAAAVGLAKEVIMEKLAAPPSSSSSLFFSLLFSDSPLGISLLRFDPPDLALDTLKADEFLEQHRAGIMERLSLLFVVLKRDSDNRTGFASASALAALRAKMLDPLAAQLARWLDPPADGAQGEALELELVRELLGRVEEAVQEAQSRSS